MMGADNWAICPRCKYRHEAAGLAAQERATAAYGIEPLEVFDRLQDEANKALLLFDAKTFREDYEIFGADEGAVMVSYSGNCSVCNLMCRFECKKLIEDVEA